MSASLPERPDLDQLRRQAKELRNSAREGDPVAAGRIARQLSPRSGDAVTLAIAQLVIARELGFASWPQLKAAVDAAGAGARRQLARQLAQFLTVSLDGPTELAVSLLEASPSIAHANICTAAVTGDADRVAGLLADAPENALAIDDERGWPPLLYVCYTHWHRIDARRAPGTAAVARLLLDAGASPNTNNGGRPGYDYRSALHGAVNANNPGITRLLLERGAEPDDRVSLTGAAEWRDHECLRLLLDHGASVAGTWALGAAAWADDDEAVRLLLEAASRTEPAARIAELADQVLLDAAQRGSVAVVETLLAFGADPNGATSEGPPLPRAVRAGQLAVASVLTDHGASNAVSSVDLFLGACARADRPEAERILAEYPGLTGQLSDTDRAAIVEAAAQDGSAPVSLMLDLGFPVDARNDLGETALHAAAYEGRTATVRLLIDHGADVDARDSRFDSTPLAFATVGSGERPNASGDWAETVRILLDAGAGREGVWITDKPPSPQVAGVLRAYGVPEVETQDDEVETQDDDEPEQSGEPSSPGDEVLREVAERLRVAYESADLELFASLLHPEVHWGAGPEGCTNRAQVLAWYQNQLRRGARGQVTAAEVHGDAIVIGLAVARAAVGARPSPPDAACQLLRVSDGLIVSITGFEDLAAARAAALRQPETR